MIESNKSLNSRSQSTMFKHKRINLQINISKLEPKAIKSKIKNALSFTLHSGEESEINKRKSYQKKVILGIKRFDEVHKERMKIYNDIKEENDNFKTRFKQTEYINDSNNKHIPKNMNKAEETFHDLIMQYKNMGYKVPDLSVNHNLFNRSPLLLENNQIQDFYKFLKQGEANSDKNIHFLSKLNTLVNDRVQMDEPDINSLKKKLSERKSVLKIATILPLVQGKDINEIQREIQEDLNYNEQLRRKFEEQNKNLSFSKKKNKSCTIVIKNREEFIDIEKKKDKIISQKTQILYKNLNGKNLVKSRNLYQNYVNKNNSQDSLSTTKNKFTLYDSTKMMSTMNKENISEVNTNNQTLNSQFIPNISSPFSKKQMNKISDQNVAFKFNKNLYQIETESEFIENKKSNQKLPLDKPKFKTEKYLSPVSILKKKQTINSNIDNSHYKAEKQSSLNLVKSSNSQMNVLKNNKNNLSIDNDIKDEFNDVVEINYFSPQAKIKQKQKTFIERERFLSQIYDQINTNHDLNNVNDMVSSYAKKFLKYDRKTIDETLNKKLEPLHIMKSITELKYKVDILNVPEMYKSTYSTIGKLEAALPNLNKIKELDDKINRLEYELAKNLNKGS